MPAAQPAGFVPDGFVPDAPPAAPASSAPPAAPVGSIGTRYAEGAWRNLNPAGLVHAVAHPIDTLGALIDAQVEQLQQAKTLYDQQRYSEAAGHLGAGLLPLVGPPAAKAGERIGSGDVAGGLGEATGLLASVEAPRLIGHAAGAATAGAQRAIEALPPGGVVADIAPDVAGMISPRAGNVLRAAQKVRKALAAAAPDAAPSPVDPPAPYLDRSVPVPASSLTPAQLAERIQFGTGVPPPPAVRPPIRVRSIADVAVPDAAPAPPDAGPLDVPARPVALSDPAGAPPSTPESPVSPQQALNEAALAARRTAYQARVQAEALAAKGQPQPTPRPGRLILTAPESAEYLRLRQTGMTDPQTLATIEAARAFQARFGTPTPTAADTRFPKGGGGSR